MKSLYTELVLFDRWCANSHYHT